MDNEHDVILYIQLGVNILQCLKEYNREKKLFFLLLSMLNISHELSFIYFEMSFLEVIPVVPKIFFIHLIVLCIS